MADSLSKAISFIFWLLLDIGVFIYLYIKTSAACKFIGIILIFGLLIYLPGKVFEKKANECYEELNKNYDN